MNEHRIRLGALELVKLSLLSAGALLVGLIVAVPISFLVVPAALYPLTRYSSRSKSMQVDDLIDFERLLLLLVIGISIMCLVLTYATHVYVPWAMGGVAIASVVAVPGLCILLKATGRELSQRRKGSEPA